MRREVSLSQGPLPPAEELARYEQVSPGIANRIVKMAEEQSTHRQSLEKSVVEAGNTRATVSIWLAFILALAVLGVGVTLILTNHGAWGISVIVGEAIALAGLFIFGKVDQRRERQAQRQQWVS